MNSLDFSAFAHLFRQACLKCFGHPPEGPLTETESKLLYNQVFEQTGLIIGWKSLKNYSFFILSESSGRQENPSIATLDTLARYVLGAPYTTEADRKEKEGHYPYWYRYKEQVVRGAGEKAEEPENVKMEEPEVREEESPAKKKRGVSRRWVGASIVFLLLGGAIILLTWFYRGRANSFGDDFHSVQEDSLAANGWFVRWKDSSFWNRRGEDPGSLTLFTLKGDNWPDPTQQPVIRNLLLHEIPCDCWTLEVHLKDFVPRQNWQQAGILLLEDSGLAGKSMRISFAYNDYNGGYPKSGTILIQAITSLGNGLDKPEEIAHVVLYHTDSLDNDSLMLRGLEHSALRIEKQGRRFRILYADGVKENTSFKEVVSHEFAMTPRYAGVFAFRGFVDSAAEIPARFRWFSLHCDGCSNR